MPLNTRSTAIPSAHRLTRPVAGACALLLAMAAGSAWAQNQTVTPGQRATANQVAQNGVPLSELAPNAPDSHTVKRGDTLWAISKIFLKSPWRWPELWGMNLDDIKNPHRIYPGQVLYLDKSGGRARLSTRRPGEGDTPTVRVSPRTRVESLSDSAIPPVNMQAIESFLAEPLIVDEATFARAPRIVATPENRVLLSLGDRAYARGQYGELGSLSEQALTMEPGKPRKFRVFRNAVPLKDPGTGEILAYEAQYVGKAHLARAETRRDLDAPALPVKPVGKDDYKPQFDNTTHNIERVPVVEKAPLKPPVTGELVPATIDIVSAKEEMLVGDRLLPEPPREFPNYVPRAPGKTQSGLIVSVYGNAVRYAAQNQVVAINRGKVHGIEDGHVLALVRDSSTLTDKTDDSRPQLRLPGEFNGLMMVFRTFDKVSYALVLDIQDGVKIGDRFSNP
jgi:LysM repeat protein